MTEAVDSASDASQPASEPDAGSVNAGALLRKAREEAGMHIGALAVALKVPVGKLEALEAGQLAQLSGPVFMRALASSVARTLKMDPAPVLALLPLATTARLHQKGDLNEPFRGEGRGMSFSAPERLLKPSILAVAALLLGAAVLMLLPNLRPLGSGAKDAPTSKEAPADTPPLADAGPDSPPAAASDPAAKPAAGTAPVSQPVVMETVVPTAAPAPAAAPAAAAVMSLPASRPAATAGTGVPVNPPASAAATAAGSGGLLAFKAIGESWVEVTDAKGVVVFRKTMAAGETAQVVGTPPLKTIIGRADSTEVTVRGKRMELQAVAKDNVARFEVK